MYCPILLRVRVLTSIVLGLSELSKYESIESHFVKIEGSALIQMEVEGKAAETKSGSDTQTSNSLVVQGITFSPPGSSRSSKVFQFFWVSETAEKVICLKCRKVLKGINTSNCHSHLESMHNSVLFPDIREYLQSIKAKQNEKQEAENKALKVRLIFFVIACFIFLFSSFRSCFES